MVVGDVPSLLTVSIFRVTSVWPRFGLCSVAGVTFEDKKLDNDLNYFYYWNGATS